MVIIKGMQEGNKSLGMLKNYGYCTGIFTFSPVDYITVDLKKLESNLFPAGSAVVQSECIKRKTRPSE